MHLVPFFGAMRLDEIGIRDYERFKAKMVKAGKKPKTINNFLSTLRRSLVSAVEWGYLHSFAPVKWMKSPKPEFDFFTMEESDRLLAATAPEFLAMVCTAVKAGLRRGELLALRWEDVDLVAEKIFVRRAAWRGQVSTPKSGKSREVAMSPHLTATLKAHRHLRGPLVFCNADGSMLTRDQIKRVVPFACRKAGLRSGQWHMLRHSFASQLAMKGVPLKMIQELLGHSTIEMTMRYAHLAPSALVGAVAVLDGDQHWDPRGHHMGTNVWPPKVSL